MPKRLGPMLAPGSLAWMVTVPVWPVANENQNARQTPAKIRRVRGFIVLKITKGGK
jgi:hypothetical protein